jgi:type I restriction enzyme S subunit
MSWKKLLFKDFITLQRGFDLPKTQMKEGEVPVLGSNCIIGYHNESKVAPQGVVTGRSGTLGVVQFIEKDFWPHNTALWVKDFKGNIPRFVYYKLQTLHLENFNGGASVPTLNRNVLDTLPVSAPDVETQSKIATMLSNYDDLIENNRRRIRLLERSLHLLYKEWFVHLRFPSHEHSKIVDGIPEGWKTGTVADFYKTSSGGTPSRKRPEFFTGEINWVKTQELNEGFIFSSDEKITEEAVKCSSAKVFPETHEGQTLTLLQIGEFAVIVSRIPQVTTLTESFVSIMNANSVTVDELLEGLQEERQAIWQEQQQTKISA